jgi:hypothetical protein
LVVTQARQKHAGCIRGRHVETAAFGIVNVLAIIGVCDGVVACLETKGVASNKATMESKFQHGDEE